MNKLLKKVIICALMFVIAVGVLFITIGYFRYQEAVNEISIIDKVFEIESMDGYVKYEDISSDFINAIVAVEDRRFFERKGIDYIALTRAALTNLFSGEVVEGGSTITQQLAKNMYFTHKASLTRKVAEVFLLYELEGMYSKEKIVELYVNLIYYGDLYYGVENASMGYFEKHANELTLNEASILAGLPQSPSRYQLSNQTELTYKRQKEVLYAMLNNGYITQEEYDEVLKGD